MACLQVLGLASTVCLLESQSPSSFRYRSAGETRVMAGLTIPMSVYDGCNTAKNMKLV